MVGARDLKTKAPSDSPFGLSKLKLKAGDTGRAKIALGARGESFAVPVLGSSALPLTVQLETSDTGTCWEATFSSVLQETATKLKAKSD